jgi:hypothetical protein
LNTRKRRKTQKRLKDEGSEILNIEFELNYRPLQSRKHKTQKSKYKYQTIVTLLGMGVGGTIFGIPSTTMSSIVYVSGPNLLAAKIRMTSVEPFNPETD